ncbi:MAG: hypothetical protein L3K00_05510 [Thermoplasmata archaeon]|nr:hypothetical protein [Thermoplasmata archaeon]MCI4361816.1 hypothetical protein [Thermoplasmata archaeon]
MQDRIRPPTCPAVDVGGSCELVGAVPAIVVGDRRLVAVGTFRTIVAGLLARGQWFRSGRRVTIEHSTEAVGRGDSSWVRGPAPPSRRPTP